MTTTPTARGKRIGIVLGDPNGVGPELALKAALALARDGCVRPVLIGDLHVINATADLLGIGHADQSAFDCVDVDGIAPDAWQPGTIDARAGAATVAYVKAAVGLALTGDIAAVAAGPHCETAVNEAGIPFSGYGGLVADLTATPRDEVFLMLEACGLRVVHATLHERLTGAIARMKPELFMSAAQAGRRGLQRMGVADPVICLLGINPHAGEGGLFGDEDERITRPAMLRLREQGMQVTGPIGADLALAERKHDLYVAPFHDQGHIAVKMLSPKGASAIVVGPPLLFASVGHGAAFDIAGKGIADASAMNMTVRLLAGAIA